MSIPLQVYFDIAAAVLAGLLILIWSVRRRRRDRLAIYRIEPDATDAADRNPRSERGSDFLGASAFGDGPPDHPCPAPADRRRSRPDAGALAAQPAASARAYKGFTICLNEKRPGLWIAAVDRRGTRKKKDPVKDSELWITPEFYQLSAALADARAAIDRGAFKKHAAEVPIKSLQE